MTSIFRTLDRTEQTNPQLNGNPVEQAFGMFIFMFLSLLYMIDNSKDERKYCHMIWKNSVCTLQSLKLTSKYIVNVFKLVNSNHISCKNFYELLRYEIFQTYGITYFKNLFVYIFHVF